MMKQKKVLLFLSIIFVCACQSANLPTTEATTKNITLPETPLPTQTTPTPLPTNTPLSTSVYVNLPIISSSNAPNLKEISRLSKGIVEKTVWFPDGKRLAVSTPAGVYIYDVNTGVELDLFFPDFPVSKMTISPDGLWLAVTDQRIVRIWDIEMGLEIMETNQGVEFIVSMVFNPGNLYFAIEKDLQSWDDENETYVTRNLIEVWDISTGELIYILNDSGLPRFNHNGSILGVESYDPRRIELRNADTGELIHTLNDGWSFAFNPNGESIVTESSVDGNYISTLFDINSGQILNTFDGQIDYQIYGVFNSTGSLLSTYNRSLGIVEVWNTSTGEEMLIISDHEGYIDIAFSPEGEILATRGALDRTVKLWNEETGELLIEIQGFYGDLGEFSPDGKFLVERRWYQGTNALIDVKTGEIALTLDKHTPRGSSVDFSPDGRILASGHDHGALHLWSVDTNQIQSTLPGFSSVMDIEFSPDGKTLAAAGINDVLSGHNIIKEAKVNIIDMDSGLSEYLWESQNEDKTWMTNIAYSPNGKTLAAVSSSNVIRLWDAQTDKINYVVIIPTGYRSFPIDFSPISQVIAFYEYDGFIQLWDVDFGKVIKRLYAPGEPGFMNDLEFSSDGETFAAANYDTVWIWDVDSNQRIAILENAGRSISSIAISPDGKLLAIASMLSSENFSYRYTITIWDIMTHKKLVTSSVFSEWIPDIVFSPDGRLLTSASADGTIRLWGVQP